MDRSTEVWIAVVSRDQGGERRPNLAKEGGAVAIRLEEERGEGWPRRVRHADGFGFWTTIGERVSNKAFIAKSLLKENNFPQRR